MLFCFVINHIIDSWIVHDVNQLSALDIQSALGNSFLNFNNLCVIYVHVITSLLWYNGCNSSLLITAIQS